MKILITGGSGLIGSHFVNTYIDKYQFDILSRQGSGCAHLFTSAKTLTFIKNIEQKSNLNEYDAVINLAGEPIVDKRWTTKQKRKICQSRWKLTHHLSKLINDSTSPPATFISGSAVGFYGRQGDDEINESFTKVYPEFSHRVCKIWEDKAKLAQAKTHVCLLRTGIVLDPKKGALSKMLPAFKCGVGGKISHGNQYMPWIHIQDMVRAIDFLLTNPSSEGVYNVTAPTPVTNKEFSKTLAQTLHRPDFATVPAFALKLLMGESADLVLYGQNAIPHHLLKEKFEFKFPTLEPALQDLLS
ncbi:TIGR01777 family oxidoreductase [Thalassotalea aquiviva]|uniref:TIGR01777 family oxidoreductase n=1 Tax=Thalassotalea aquiviva TaxID=3242415 RepID=UPI00352B707E